MQHSKDDSQLNVPALNLIIITSPETGWRWPKAREDSASALVKHMQLHRHCHGMSEAEYTFPAWLC